MKYRYNDYNYEEAYRELKEIFNVNDYEFSTPLWASDDTYTGYTGNYYADW